jgi:hypothetical protein
MGMEPRKLGLCGGVNRSYGIQGHGASGPLQVRPRIETGSYRLVCVAHLQL